MSRPRVSLRHGLLFAVVVAMTTWFTLFTWRGFAVDYGEYLGPLLLFGLLLTLVGAALRWLRVPVLAVPVAQLLLTALVLVAMYGGREGGGPLPTPRSVRSTVETFADAVHTAATYPDPIPFDVPSVAPLLIACGAVAVILVDLAAGGLGRVPLSGLALLMVYTLPVTVWGSRISWWVFVLSASGFMLMLFLREDERFSQWGRQITGDPTDGDPGGFGVRTGSARSNALSVGSVATVAALFVPLLVPSLDLELPGTGNGPGSGDSVAIVNPMTDMVRDLKQGVDYDLITLTTDEPNPGYLRFAVLTNFNGNQWTTGNRTIPDEQVAGGQQLPPPLGVDNGVPRTTYSASYQTSNDFGFKWLPVPAPAAEVTAPGVWKYDVSTMDFLSTEFASNLTYSATGIDLELTPEMLISAGPPPGTLLTEYTTLPSGVPEIAETEAFAVTAGQTTDFGRAVALQDWFRNAGGFTYSLDATPGNGSQDLEAFLTEGPDGRTGYCEQFASAMTVMARILGIPARVAVGFLRPYQVGEDIYIYSARDLHAWPELYFQGAGWVRFEPTPGGPGGRTGRAPDYTLGGLPTGGPSGLPSSNATLTEDPTRGASDSASRSDSANDGAGAAGSGSGFPWLPVLVGAVSLIVLAVLLMVPRTLRRVRRESRWHAGTAEAAWAELRDAAIDLGVVWPPGRSPRATGDIVGEQFAATGDVARPVRGRDTNPVAAEALDRLVHAVEMERYAPRAHGLPPEELRADVTACVEALRSGVSERSRRRADYLPISLTQGRGKGPTQVSDVESSTDQDQVVEHVGR